MTDLDLDALEAVARAATQGEWMIETDSEQDYELGIPYSEWPSVLIGPRNALASELAIAHGEARRVQEVPELTDADAEHIATFDPPTVLALIAKLREAEAVIEEVDDLVTRHHLDTTVGQAVFKITGNYYKPANQDGGNDGT